MRRITRSGLLLTCLWHVAAGSATAAETKSLEGWQPTSLREEMRPQFSTEEHAGPDRAASLVISADGREGLAGAWVKSFPVSGGKYYRFRAERRTEDIAVPRRSVVAKITWKGEDGKLVPGDGDLARPEYPSDGKTDAQGWTEVADTYLVPEKATQAVVELHLRWAPHGTVRWSRVTLSPVDQPPSRKARLATVHFRPRGGKSPAENRAMFAEHIAEAGRQKADLVCLPESLTYCGTGLTMAEVAEPIPGPSTEYFGKLAREHNLYIVAGLTERSGDVVYNTAALIGPDGKLVGKYRKVCLPREEIEAGVTPGQEYPVFETRFGRVGMMVCWDVHFPEVARNLSNHGAEVIAMPIWGGNPALARARAIENQVYLVTSTYTDPDRDWMKSAVFDYEGQLLVEGKEWGTVLVTEVDLERRKHWQWLGDFKARIYRERPAGGFQE